MSTFETVGEIVAAPDRVTVFEHGWQSWSPSGGYPATGAAPRPGTANRAVMGYRWDSPAPSRGFQGEGLLAVDPGDGGPIRLWSAPDPTSAVPSIRVRVLPDRLVVSANGPVSQSVDSGPGGLAGTLARWATSLAEAADLGPIRSCPPGWCSWYCYWGGVTEADVAEELRLIEKHRLDAPLILLDDGYQAEIGDWLTERAEFGSIRRLADRIRDTGRQAGIWIAPLLVGAHSRIAAEHPEWRVTGAHAGHNWDQDVAVLDVTHPGAADYLDRVFRAFVEAGYTHFKLDFLYAGALPGKRHGQADPIAAYREALRLIRAAVGPDAVLHGCGAPILPSLGLVDVMRTSPDTSPWVQPRAGEMSRPGQVGARQTGAAREFLHGRWWVNDPDCLLARPEVEEREQWAAHIEASGGLRLFSDPVATLDDWARRTIRRLLVHSSQAPTMPA